MGEWGAPPDYTIVSPGLLFTEGLLFVTHLTPIAGKMEKHDLSLKNNYLLEHFITWEPSKGPVSKKMI